MAGSFALDEPTTTKAISLEVAFHGAHRPMHVAGDLFVGATARGVQGGVELAGG
jgi:hypothetical protein